MSDYIHPELIPNILARLSVDDVLRCTSVCKSWYSLITCPSFASLHLNLSSPSQEPRLLVMDDKRNKKSLSRSRYHLFHDNLTFDEIAELDLPCSKHWSVIDSVNGLFCMSNRRGPGVGTVMLWNPSLRKALIFPNSRAVFCSGLCYNHTVGFGFVATSNEYKIVSFLYDEKTQRGTAEIYELSTGSWRKLKLKDYSNVDVGHYPQAHLNGILHWYKRSQEQGNHTFLTCICSLDLKDEKFGTLMVPTCLRNDDKVYFESSIYRESLCLVNHSSDRFCDIWVMKEYGIVDSWEKLFIIDIEQPLITRYPRFRHNGELLFGKYYDETRYDKIELVSYDCNNNQVKNLGVFADGPDCDRVFYAYP